MKLQVLGVKRVMGTSKAGAAFDICSVIATVPVDVVSNEKITVQGFGYEVAEMPLDPSVLSQFSAVKFPASLELVTDTRLYRGKLETFVTGIQVAPGVRAA